MQKAPRGQATAEAQPNIALIKYWGKRAAVLNLPAAGSLSITLDAPHTRTSVHFDAAFTADELLLNGVHDAGQTARVSAFLDLARARAGTALRAHVVSHNDFPTGAGLASSASGFAALAVASDRALGLGLDPAELSTLARRGSGSAARSIFGGFVAMQAGTRADGEDACATPLLAAEEWPLKVVVAITTHAAKAVSSSAGMQASQRSSRYYGAWIASIAGDLVTARAAIAARDFARLAEVSEANCLAMHAVMLATRPGLIYWNSATLDAIHCVRRLRAAGVAVFFTIDAGPQLKAVCLPKDAERVARELRAIAGIEQVHTVGLGAGARLVEGAT